MQTVVLLLLLQTWTSYAQSFLEAIDAYPNLSSFRQLLQTNPAFAEGLLSNTSLSALNGTGVTLQTILVPNNDAFTKYQQMNRHPLTSLSSSDLTNVIQYHSLQGALSSSDVKKPQGLISDTALTDAKYDNRELSSNGAQLPQVVFIAPAPSTGSSMPITQAGNSSSNLGGYVESGLGQKVNVELVDGKFDGGMFQTVDGYVQFDPVICQPFFPRKRPPSYPLCWGPNRK